MVVAFCGSDNLTSKAEVVDIRSSSIRKKIPLFVVISMYNIVLFKKFFDFEYISSKLYKFWFLF